jgi:hypothetical protein
VVNGLFPQALLLNHLKSIHSLRDGTMPLLLRFERIL